MWKQSARNRNNFLSSLFWEFGLRLISEAYYLWAYKDFILVTHVDDLVLAYGYDSALTSFKQFFLASNCIINDLGEVSQFLGFEVQRDLARCML